MSKADFEYRDAPAKPGPPSGCARAALVIAVLNPPAGAELQGVASGRWDVRWATDAATLERQVRAAAVDAVVVSGAAEDAIATATALRKPGRAAPAVPVVLVVDACRDDQRARAYEAGADDCIELPVGMRELAARVEAAVAAGRRGREGEGAHGFLGRVLSGVSDALTVLDRDWRYVFVNERVAELTGVARADLLGRDIWSLFPALRDTPFAQAAGAAMAQRRTQRCQFEFGPLGRSFDARIYPTAEGITVFATDVTEAERAGAALRESEARFQALAGSVAEVFWIFDADAYRYEYVSPAVTDVLGVSADALYADPDLPRTLLVDGDDWAPFAEPRRGSEARRRLRFRIRRPDGALRWIESHSYPMAEPGGGGGRRICGVSQDVTDTIETEQQLRAARDALSVRAQDLERRFRLLIEGTREYAIYMLDAGGHIVTWNEGAHRLTGYSEGEVVGRHFSLLYPDAGRAAGRPRALLAAAARDGSVDEEGWRVRRDGNAFWTAATVTAVRDEAGVLQGFGKVLRDLTERRVAEQHRQALLESLRRRTEELEEANRALEADGHRLQELATRVQQAQESERRRLARDLHDDVAQRLAALHLLLEPAGPHAREESGTLAEARGHLDEVLATLRRLMGNLRPPELDDLGLVPALRRLAHREAGLWGVPVDVEAEAGQESFGEAIDTACYRVAQEALHNALKHSGTAGVRVGVRVEGDEVALSVTDEGEGFDPETAAAEGSFGLMGMRERVELHGGRLDVSAAPGRGTRVVVRLPMELAARGIVG